MRNHIQNQLVAITHETRYGEIRRLAVDFRRRANLLDFAVLHDDDAVGQRQGLILVMRDVQRGAAELAMDAADFGAHFQAQLGIEIGERLIHQDQRRFDDDGAGNRYALLLAAGQLAGQLVHVLRQLHQVERALDAGLDLGGRGAAHEQAEADVPGHRHMREQGVILEHHTEAALFGRQGIDTMIVKIDAAVRQGQ